MADVWREVLSSLAGRFSPAGGSAAAPGRVYLVGGAVRDLLIGRSPRDVDLLVEVAASDEPLVLREAAALSGMEPVLFDRRPPFTHRVVVEGVIVDLSFCRPGGLREALERRDFTFNAIALPLASLLDELAGGGFSSTEARAGIEKHLVDPFGGLDSLRARRIRATSARSLDDDPLRMLRAVRLACTLPGFAIDEPLAASIRGAAARIAEPATERVQAELDQILRSRRAGEALRSMDALDLLAPLLPELEPLRGLKQPAHHHDYDALEHTLRAVETAEELARGCAEVRLAALGSEDEAVLKWAALFHDVGKAATATVDEDGARHFYGHEAISAALAEEAFARLRVASRIAEPVVKLIDLHLRLGALAPAGTGDKPIRRLIRAAGELLPLLVLLSLADRRSAGGERAEEKEAALLEICRRALSLRVEVEAAVSAPPLLDGRDIMKILGLPPGPRVGSIARWLERLRAEGSLTTREDSEALLRSLPPARTRD